jgi:hypothetical protein
MIQRVVATNFGLNLSGCGESIGRPHGVHPVKPMIAEAASADMSESQWGLNPKIEILTIGALFSGKKTDLPAHEQTNQTFKAAPKAKAKKGKAGTLNFD